MRRIVTFNNVSADGFFSTNDGKHDWAVQDPEFDRFIMKHNPEVDAALFGRVTYQEFERFWPGALDNPDMPDQIQAFARSLADMKKVVFSRTLKKTNWQNVTIEREFVPEQVEALKAKKGADIIVFGSGTIAAQLAKNGLVDEFQYVVNPVLLGEGKRLFHNDKVDLDLTLAEAKPFKSGKILVRYEPKGPREKRPHLPVARQR